MTGQLERLQAGLAHARCGRYEDALSEFDMAIELQPDSVPAHYNRGCMYVRLGMPRRAKMDFGKALALDPNNERARQKLAAMRDDEGGGSPSSRAAQWKPKAGFGLGDFAITLAARGRRGSGSQPFEADSEAIHGAAVTLRPTHVEVTQFYPSRLKHAGKLFGVVGFVLVEPMLGGLFMEGRGHQIAYENIESVVVAPDFAEIAIRARPMHQSEGSWSYAFCCDRLPDLVCQLRRIMELKGLRLAIRGCAREDTEVACVEPNVLRTYLKTKATQDAEKQGDPDGVVHWLSATTGFGVSDIGREVLDLLDRREFNYHSSFCQGVIARLCSGDRQMAPELLNRVRQNAHRESRWCRTAAISSGALSIVAGVTWAGFAVSASKIPEAVRYVGILSIFCALFAGASVLGAGAERGSLRWVGKLSDQLRDE